MPIVFYQQIEEYKAANVDPEELVRLAKDIYDRFVMRNGGHFHYASQNNLITIVTRTVTN